MIYAFNIAQFIRKESFYLWLKPNVIFISLRVYLDRIYFAETKNWKHCSKIIFKCVNNTVGSIFNEKVAEKYNLWVREQCTYTLFTVGSQHLRLLLINSAWTVTALLQNAWKQKKEKEKKERKCNFTNTDAASVESKRTLISTKLDNKVDSTTRLKESPPVEAKAL